MKNRKLALIALAGFSLISMARAASASSSIGDSGVYGMLDAYVGTLQIKEIQVKDIVIPPAPPVAARPVETSGQAGVQPIAGSPNNKNGQAESIAVSAVGALKASKAGKVRS